MVPPEHDEQLLRLFLAHQHRIYRFILSLVPRWSDAEDLFQQTCLTIWQKVGEFDRERDFVRWACGIAHNHVRNFLRQDRRRPVLDDEVLEQLADRRLQEGGYFDDLHRALAECVQGLPAAQRQLVEDCYGSGLTIREVARRQRRTPNVVYKLLRQVRQALYECVTRRVAWEAES
ncbi:MAG: sigma-70 family RNA polymerase sigma factor [Gemmataceae bacterium]|nr:sigma-70 family RNA polymerase sigma factor [Gemmataceae bacterium]MDW8265385.1 sigma-70 family RNA polymerase sigma factor [Gemmataceae bacterium]